MSPQHAQRTSSRRSLLRAGALGVGTLGMGTLGLSMSGCASDNSNEITFWHFIGPGTPQNKWLTALVDAWNAEHKVKVKTRFVPFDDYANGPTLQTAFSSGDGPDVFMLSPGDFIRYHNAEVLVDLTPYVEKSVIKDYLPGTLDSRSFNDHVFGLPMESEPLALFYSVDAFEKAKLSEADVPQTWDQLLEVSEKLTTSDQFGLVLETNPGYYQNFNWYPFLWMGDGSPISTDQKHSTFDTKASVDALRLWQDTIAAHAAPSAAKGTGGNDSISNLASGYCAMQQTGVWAIGEIAQQSPDFSYGAAPLPLPPGGKQVTTAGGWALAANSQGKNPESAAEFIAWALGSNEPDCIERGRQWNTVIKKNLPVRKKVEQLAHDKGDFDSKLYRMFAKDIAPKAVGEPRYPVEIYRSISDALQACQLDGADPAKAAADASDQIQTFLSSYEGASIL